MNLHPFLVHFPIALLALSSVIECIPEKYIKKYFKEYELMMVLLVVGVGGALVSLSSGEAIEHEFRQVHDLVELHSAFATATTWIYVVLLVLYLLHLFFTKPNNIYEKIKSYKITSVFQKTYRVLFKKSIRILLALTAFISLCITGALGAAITHGPNVDFVVTFIYNLFF